MKKREVLFGLLVIGLTTGGLCYYYNNIYGSPSNKIKESKNKEGKKGKEDKTELNAACFKGSINVLKTWDMPKELVEISGISWINNDQVAAIQDNECIIYIYNFANGGVEKQIKFGGVGDYEGIAYVSPNYFVMRSDGFVYEINNSGKLMNQYDLPLTVEDNIESFYFDAANDRLLMGQKDGSKGTQSKKIYSFDLASRKFNATPIFALDMNDPMLNCEQETKKGNKKGKKNLQLRPSALTIHPKTKDIYIADGPNQRILVLSPDQKPKYFLSLDKKLFPQVEGLMFSPNGELYVSTEGVKGMGNISKVSVLMD